MDCLVLPCYVMKRRRRSGPLFGYRRLKKAGLGGGDGAGSPVMVVVGKERRVFLVDPFVLEENPFRVLIETQKEKAGRDDHDHDHDHHNNNGEIWPGGRERRRVIFVDVDAIFFEHLLWLLHNDCSSLFKLNVEEIIDFYAQDS